ncbi:glycosyl transferase family 2 [Methanobacterium lacus]|uniref:Glycosyl transferase family 2 n=1 Tax=Methanobacterium lacus (strain AL-21) TaxID=877455 RepID=F0TBM7_METLA|nr:glycosyltransferase [Methanobacterium lacus]ADZ09104.1 glycosyl transferase family 2 [Methanobacterium lacus]
MDILIVILYIVMFLLVWQFVGYPALMGSIAFISRKYTKNNDNTFKTSVSILVPTYNEEKVIRLRLTNLMKLNYPNELYEIIVVDSGSNDKTKEIVEEIMDKQINLKPELKLAIQSERKGKASAINFGKQHCNGEIVLVTDANAIFEKNVLNEIIPCFKDSNVGGVGGRFVVSNPNANLTSSTQFYWTIEYIMRMGESILDSVCLFHGEMHAWRKGLIHCDEKIISEDLNIAIQLRKAGYKLKYAPDALVFEQTPNNIDEQIIQRTKTTVGTLQNIFKYWKFFIIPRNLYVAFIFPSHKILPMLSPFLLFSVLVLYILIWNINVILINIFICIMIFGCLLIYLLIIKSYFERNKVSGSFSLFKIVKYVLINEFIVLKGWKDYIFNNYSVLWEKVSR